ncbi:juvenile hormone acid O-methyltransferase-like [Pogonomyrmex barbatus]|uniref:Juvenile hormone acid O-methyltransferase-like n=1 Tax=Pogonomyrmex barbatus TaxID=144034 RepID=A0A6I9WFJ1_9HYME|nr:juvenile hormone acid O-methyltransferase-like [Pogonomyrmex barbatus]
MLQTLQIFLQINLIFYLILRSVNGSSIKLWYNPSMYVATDKLQREKALAFINEFSENLKNISGKCMDVGCGPGDITKDIFLPALNPNAVVIGTDISESMIEYANKMSSVKNRLKYEILDIQTKQLPNQYISEFDHIFSVHTLHWCNDIRQAFKNIYRMLRSNGTMLVLFVSSHDIFKILDIMIQDKDYASYISDIKRYTWPFQNSVNPRSELKELLEEIGFTIIHCSLREAYFVDNSDQFLCKYF